MCSSDKRLVCMRKNGLGRNERRSLEHSQIKLLSRCVSLAVFLLGRLAVSTVISGSSPVRVSFFISRHTFQFELGLGLFGKWDVKGRLAMAIAIFTVIDPQTNYTSKYVRSCHGFDCQ